MLTSVFRGIHIESQEKAPRLNQTDQYLKSLRCIPMSLVYCLFLSVKKYSILTENEEFKNC